MARTLGGRAGAGPRGSESPGGPVRIQFRTCSRHVGPVPLRLPGNRPPTPPPLRATPARKSRAPGKPLIGRSRRCFLSLRFRWRLLRACAVVQTLPRRENPAPFLRAAPEVPGHLAARPSPDAAARAQSSPPESPPRGSRDHAEGPGSGGGGSQSRDPTLGRAQGKGGRRNHSFGHSFVSSTRVG